MMINEPYDLFSKAFPNCVWMDKLNVQAYPMERLLGRTHLYLNIMLFDQCLYRKIWTHFPKIQNANLILQTLLPHFKFPTTLKIRTKILCLKVPPRLVDHQKKKNHKEIHNCTNRNVKLHFESFTLKHYLLLPMTYQNLSIQKATVVH